MSQRKTISPMEHDPALIKPYADYHHKRDPLVVIQPAAHSAQSLPPARNWVVAQLVPLVQGGLARNGTHAVAILNLSWLPVTSSPQVCLEWARHFRNRLDNGDELIAASRSADQQVLGRA